MCEFNITHGSAGARARYEEVADLLTGRRDANALLEWWNQTTAEFGVAGLAALGLTEDGIAPVAEAAAPGLQHQGQPGAGQPERLRRHPAPLAVARAATAAD